MGTKYAYRLARNVRIGDMLLMRLIKTERDEWHPEVETDFVGVAPVSVDSIEHVGKKIRFFDKDSERFIVAKSDERVRILKEKTP